MLSSLPLVDLILWGSTTLLTVVLISLLILWDLYRRLPFFTAYLLVNLAQTAIQVVVYEFYGWNSPFSYAVIWATQIGVVLARVLATREFCQRVLGWYVGVWALAARVLAVCGLSVLVTAVYFGKDGFRYAVTTLEIGSEAFIATVVVGTFVFVRYYRAHIQPGALLLGLALGLNSCFKILNDAVLARFFKEYAHTWNEAAMIAFVCVLAVWGAAIRAEAKGMAAQRPELRAAEIYRTLSPAVNERLAHLNQQLMRLWKVEQPKP